MGVGKGGVGVGLGRLGVFWVFLGCFFVCFLCGWGGGLGILSVLLLGYLTPATSCRFLGTCIS